MDVLQAVVLGAVEGLTEFLPVSSTGRLTIAERVLGLDIDDDAVTAFTAVVQVGAIAAVLVAFREDLVRLLGAVLRGVRSPPSVSCSQSRPTIARHGQRFRLAYPAPPSGSERPSCCLG